MLNITPTQTNFPSATFCAIAALFSYSRQKPAGKFFECHRKSCAEKVTLLLVWKKRLYFFGTFLKRTEIFNKGRTV